MSKTILIVEDEQVLRESLAGLLEAEGYLVQQAPDGRAAHEMLLQGPVDVVLSDVRMPEMDGMTLLGHIRQLAPQTPVIMVTAYGTVDNAVEAMRAGAWDYLLKPVQFDDLLLKIARALQYQEVAHDHQVMTDQQAAESSFHNIVSQSPEMARPLRAGSQAVDGEEQRPRHRRFGHGQGAVRPRDPLQRRHP